MKVAIYSPYLDTFGGGERYIATIAEVLSSRVDVSILLDNNLNSLGSDIFIKKFKKFFDLDLSNINFIKAPIGKDSNFFERLIFMKNYDLLFYLTDGSVFYPTAKRNILHIQTPLVGNNTNSAWGKFKLNGWDIIIYNSKFTKQNSQKNWPINSRVIYPPVDVKQIKILKKKKRILSVGRFFGYLKNKKHEILINVFKDLYRNKNLKDWNLNFVGSASLGDKSYIMQLQKNAQELPVNFYPNISYDELVKLYGESSIYWHAAGFGETDPTKMEHFGISTVEAMAGGCVPLVIGKGGQLEIVEDNKSGFTWNNLEQLKKLTMKLINEKELWQKLSVGAINRSKHFSKEKFQKNILDLSMS